MMKKQIIIEGDENDGDYNTEIIDITDEKLNKILYEANELPGLEHPAFTLRSLYKALKEAIKENPDQNWERYGEYSYKFEFEENFVPTMKLLLKHLGCKGIENIVWTQDEGITPGDYLYINDILGVPSCHTIHSIRLVETRELEF